MQCFRPRCKQIAIFKIGFQVNKNFTDGYCSACLNHYQKAIDHFLGRMTLMSYMDDDFGVFITANKPIIRCVFEKKTCRD